MNIVEFAELLLASCTLPLSCVRDAAQPVVQIAPQQQPAMQLPVHQGLPLATQQQVPQQHLPVAAHHQHLQVSTSGSASVQDGDCIATKLHVSTYDLSLLVLLHNLSAVAPLYCSNARSVNVTHDHYRKPALLRLC